MKPDDISQEVWEDAIKLANSDNQWYDPRELIARAIQRAVEREREECAQVAEDISMQFDGISHGRKGIFFKKLAENFRFHAAAIRARGK